MPRDPLLNSRSIRIGDIDVGNDLPFVLLMGPCQIEGRDHALMMAEKIAEACTTNGRRFIYKSSYDKANRSSIDTARGVGMDEGLRILEEIRDTFGCPVLTDVHAADQCAPVAEVVDVLQIPAFLCRQTDLLVAAAKTGKAINVKKGQFLAPADMWNVANKIIASGNDRVMLCERGASFGYNTLVSDFRAIPIMAETGCPVVFDATHSVQQPGGQGTTSGGQRQFVETLARAAVAIGVAALFMETHQDPDNAPSDGPNMVPVDQMQGLLERLGRIEEAAAG
ncbi:3-deoxy-8-phosphooctulonate synthase [Sphingomicrobium clamense]|uniref:2-dehydro-3-deoxyphosphooctonate aldolase n=1 Tax=Sphingomicrobium clamense TaxID=2851013 RepID=A0ABS6V4F2_9SPHN|nr:3-deoxy-8-phosphooctulonate synthase [Sphingomicrobium sp. B8]MBW0143963.1 3-deoxy-8-phosphooctulonate synthase [Sphingomicrobium sp. B8]